MQLPAIDLRIETERLVLEPVLEKHAAVMIEVIGNPSLYKYIPFDPPSLDKLQQRYKRWEPRISPNGDEIWLNWVARLQVSETYIGDFQVGYKENREASIAYMLNENYQHQGYATEGLTRIIDILFQDLDILSVKAWLDTRNQPSIDLVKRLDFTLVETLKNADHFKGQISDEFVFEMQAKNWLISSQ